MSAQRITIATIAEQAGVSVPTVSKVLNGRADVSSATRAKVEELLRQAGYQRRRAVATAPEVAMVDLVFNEIGSPWAMELIRGAENAARDGRAEIVLSECGGAHQPRQDWIDSVLVRRPAGIVMVFSDLAPDQRAQLDARSIPYVVVDPVGEEDADVPSVGSANWSGGRMAARHLVEQGHRRIAAITGPMDLLTSRARMGGFSDAARRAGVELEPELVYEGNFDISGGYEAAQHLLGRAAPPSAIFAGSDLHALGVYRAAFELGLRIPEDLSVVGYDDLPLASWMLPALTTVAQPLYQMAYSATSMVLGLARGEEPVSQKLDLAVQLAVRHSTAGRDA